LGLLAALAVGGWFAGNALAQPGTAPATQPSVMGRTRVGFVNLHEVLKGYTKYVNLRDELKRRDEGFVNTLKVKQAKLEDLNKELRAPGTTPARKDAIDKEMKQIQFDMNVLKQDAEKELVKYHNDNVAQIYREVYQVVQDYAQQNQIDVVMRFNEDWGKDYYEPAKVVARMSIPYFPMYYHTSLEMTGPVKDTLNARFSAAATPPAGGGNAITPVSGTKKQP
jgi:Skp family chaperone for outer membrane proteins